MARLLLCFKPLTRDEETGSSTTHRSFQGRRSEVQPTHSSDSGASHETRRVVTFVELLKRRSEPLGLVLKGGADHSKPVYVGQLYPGGAAEKSEALQVGDIIRGINGTATDHLNQSEVNALLNNSGNVINLEVEFEALPGSDVDDGTVKKTALVRLKRGRNSFGFTVSGGRTENRPITVSNVMMGSMAYKNGILKAGDRILRINWNDVTSASQLEALSHLKASEDVCALEIEYDVTLHTGLEEYGGQLSVELLKPKGVSLGISLRESSGPPSQGGPLIISRVREAGIADRCGALHVGDRLLSVNKEALEAKSIADIQHMLKHCDLVVELEIILAHNFPPRPESFSDSGTSLLPSSLSSRLSTHSLISSSSLGPSHLATAHPEAMLVRLAADDIGYGLSLRGGATERGVYPIVIASIEDGGPAAKLGQLQVGDQVLCIDGIKLEGRSLQEAMKLVQEADSVLEMDVMFEVQDKSPPNSGTFEVHVRKKTASLNLGITINGSRSRGDTIWISSLKKGGIAYRSGMLHSGDVLLAINSQSLESCNLREAAQVLMGAGEAVTLTIGKESPPQLAAAASSSETIIYSVELHRNQQSLGITLTGNRDKEGHPVVISKIKEDGVAYKTGALKVGDRILAINGESLYNKTMPEAVRLLNSAGDVVNLKISKASRNKHRSRHVKGGSPTGRHRGGHGREHGGGLPVYHRESFGSSSGSSFVGSSYAGRGHRSLNNYRPKYSFVNEPALGESASGCNTPDNVSLVSFIPPPSLYAEQSGGRAVGGARRVGNHTPSLSEVSASMFSHSGGAFQGTSYVSHASSSRQPMDDDQTSNISTRSKKAPYPPSPSPLESRFPLGGRITPSSPLESRLAPFSPLVPPMFQCMPRQQSVPGMGAAPLKRDSSTDDEMSSYEAEGRAPQQRRSSLPLDRPSQHSPQYLPPREPLCDPPGAGGVVWDFKTRRTSIPVGRVTPLETERLTNVVAPYAPLRLVKAEEDKVQHKGRHPPPLPSTLATPLRAKDKGLPHVTSVTPLPGSPIRRGIASQAHEMSDSQSVAQSLGQERGLQDTMNSVAQSLGGLQDTTNSSLGQGSPALQDTTNSVAQTLGQGVLQDTTNSVAHTLGQGSPALQDSTNSVTQNLGHGQDTVKPVSPVTQSSVQGVSTPRNSLEGEVRRQGSVSDTSSTLSAEEHPALATSDEEASQLLTKLRSPSSESPPLAAASTMGITSHAGPSSSDQQLSVGNGVDLAETEAVSLPTSGCTPVAGLEGSPAINAASQLHREAVAAVSRADLPALVTEPLKLLYDGDTDDLMAEEHTPRRKKSDTKRPKQHTIQHGEITIQHGENTIQHSENTIQHSGNTIQHNENNNENTNHHDENTIQHTVNTNHHDEHTIQHIENTKQRYESTVQYTENTDENTREYYESSPNGTIRRDPLVRQNSKTRFRRESGVAEINDISPLHSPSLQLRHEATLTTRLDHSSPPLLPHPSSSTIYQSDSSNTAKRSQNSDHQQHPFHRPMYPKTDSPYSSLRKHRVGADGKHKQTARSDKSPPRRSLPSMAAGNRSAAQPQQHAATSGNRTSQHAATAGNRTSQHAATAGNRTSQHTATTAGNRPLIQTLKEYEKTIHNADEFGKAITALAESGSSDQDSDSEPRSKIQGQPVQELARVKEKMRTSQSTVMHRVMVRKDPGEVSFGFSIADGQYDQGVYVKTVKSGGPSDRGGLQQYDKIMKVNDVVLQSEHKSSNVYPLLKKYEHDLILTVQRQA